MEKKSTDTKFKTKHFFLVSVIFQHFEIGFLHKALTPATCIHIYHSQPNEHTAQAVTESKERKSRLFFF